MFHAKRREVLGRVELGVEPDHEPDVADLEMNKHIFERDGEVGLQDLFDCMGWCEERSRRLL